MPYLFLLAALVSPAFEDLEILDERILVVSEHAEQLDKRLKLAECPDDPIIVPPAGGVVVVRCPALGWRLRVPVKAPSAAVAPAEIVVRKGELVECVSGGPGFAVSTLMVALEDAGIGQLWRELDLNRHIELIPRNYALGLAHGGFDRQEPALGLVRREYRSFPACIANRRRHLHRTPTPPPPALQPPHQRERVDGLACLTVDGQKVPTGRGLVGGPNPERRGDGVGFGAHFTGLRRTGTGMLQISAPPAGLMKNGSRRFARASA